MSRIKMMVENEVTFRQGCEEYLEDCKARNLREGTLKHYTDSMKQLKKYIDEDIYVRDITKETIEDFIRELRDNPAINDQSLYTYARDLKTILYLLFY